MIIIVSFYGVTDYEVFVVLSVVFLCVHVISIVCLSTVCAMDFV